MLVAGWPLVVSQVSEGTKVPYKDTVSLSFVFMLKENIACGDFFILFDFL